MKDGAVRDLIGVTVIAEVGLKRRAFLDGFPWLTEPAVLQDHAAFSSSLPSASSLTRNQEVKSSSKLTETRLPCLFVNLLTAWHRLASFPLVLGGNVQVPVKWESPEQRESPEHVWPLPCSSALHRLHKCPCGSQSTAEGLLT